MNRAIVIAAATIGLVSRVQATTYYWTGTATGGDGTTWSSSLNWSTESASSTTAASDYPNASSAAVEFGANASLTINGSYAVGSVTMADNVTVTLVGSGNTHILTDVGDLGTSAASGDKIVLNNVSLQSCSLAAGASTNWYADIEIAGSEDVYLYCKNADNKSDRAHVDLLGNLTGSGTVHLAQNGNSTGRGGISLYGDNESFAGVCYIHPGYANRCPTTFCSATAGSPTARWIYAGGADKNDAICGGTINLSSSTVKFGTYEGTNYIFACESGRGNNVLELGGTGVDFTCALSAICRTNAERGNEYTTLRKVGAGTMTFDDALGQPYIATWDLAEGVLHLSNPSISTFAATYGGGTSITPKFSFSGGLIEFDQKCLDASNAIIDISSYIADSKSPVAVNVLSGQTITWATSLASSNEGGLTKTGAGTLTLTSEPLYSGTTTVEGGTLVTPATSIDALVVRSGATVTASNATSVGSLVLESGATFVAPNLASIGDITLGAGVEFDASADTSLGAVILGNGAVLTVARGTSFTSVDATAGGKVAVDLTGAAIDGKEKNVITVTGYADAESLVAILDTTTYGYASYAYSYDTESGALKTTITRKASTFVWNGADGADWNAAGNWLYSGDASTVVPSEVDTVQIATAGTISLASAEGEVSNVVVNADVTLSGNKLCAALIHGTGRISLSGGAIGTANSVDCIVSNDVEIVGSTANYFYNTGADVHIYGNLTGSGTLTGQSNGNNRGVKFYGTNTTFSGSFTATGANTRDETYFAGAYCSSSNAVWKIDSSSYAYNSDPLLFKKSGDYHFGSFNGSSWAYAVKSGSAIESGVTITIGYLNQNDSFNLSSRGYCDLYKVGSGVLSMKMKTGGNYYWHHIRGHLKDGTLSLADKDAELLQYTFEGGTLTYVDFTDADPSALIKNSTSPISFDTSTSNVTWATALDSSNTAGLTKKGSGTLTLSAAPEYTGTTTLLAGTLKIPTSAGVTVTTTLNGYRVSTAVDGDYTVYSLVRKGVVVIVK